MKQFIFKPAAKNLTALAMGLGLFATAAVAGVDSYQIYLNNKLIMKQYVTQPLTLESLPLDNAGPNDVLVIYYNHCGATGKGRTISIKDTRGALLKEWKFADAANGTTCMTIPVKEIAVLQTKSPRLLLCYSSKELPEGRMLTSLAHWEKILHAFHPANNAPGRAGRERSLAG